MTTLSDHIARNVAAERARRRWKQAELGQRLGWSTASVSAVETGTRRLAIDDLPLLCRVFQIPLAQLCFGADEDDIRAMRL